ncbi:hypothetical protein Tco_0134531 [Tanacetum coccineum]
MPTEMELVLELTQQGSSHEVSVSTEGVEELKRIVKIKGVKKEALHSLRQKPGPAGFVQAAKLYKIADMREGREESVMYTQEYIRKVIEDIDEDGDFTRGSWRSVIEFVDVDGGS